MPSSPTEELRTATIQFPDGTVAGTIQHPPDLSEEEIDRAANQVLVGATARKYGVPPDLALAVAQQESRFDQAAVSPKGARGVMQLMPDTAEKHGVDPNDLYGNIDGGVRELRDMLQKYGEPDLALAAYNAGPGAVDTYQGVPPFKETQNYIARVSALRAEFPDPQAAESTGEASQAQPSAPLVAEPMRATPTAPGLGLPGIDLPSDARPATGMIDALLGAMPRGLANATGGMLDLVRILEGTPPTSSATQMLQGLTATPPVPTTTGETVANRVGLQAGGLPVGAALGAPMIPNALSALGAGLGGGAAATLAPGHPMLETAATVAGGLAPAALGAVAQRIVQPAGPTGAARAAENIPLFEKYGIPFTPGNVTEGRTARLIEQGVTGGSEGTRYAQNYYAARQAAYEEAKQGLVQRLPPAASVAEEVRPALGQFAQTAVREVTTGLKENAAAVFDEATALGADVVAPMGALKSAAADLLAKEVALPPAVQQNVPLLRGLAALPDQMPFNDARELQKRIGAMVGPASGIPLGQQKVLFRGVSDALEDVAVQGGASEEALALVQRGREMTKAAYGLVRENGKTTALGRIADLPADRLPTVADRLFQRSALGDVRAMRGVMSAEDWGLFERYGVEKLFAAAAKRPENLGKQLATLGDDFLSTYFSPETKQALTDLAAIAEKGQMDRGARVAAGGMGVGASMLQGRDVLKVGAGVALYSHPVAAALGLLGPPAAARLITSKAGATWLSKGLQLPSGNPGALAIASRITSMGQSEDIDQAAMQPMPAPRVTALPPTPRQKPVPR